MTARTTVGLIDLLLGGEGGTRAELQSWMRESPRGKCALLWRGKTRNGLPRLLVPGSTLFGFNARELWWCVSHGRDEVPEGAWLYRTCARDRCMDLGHIFVGPAGLGRTLGKMREVGFPFDLFVVDGWWTPQEELLESWRLWVRREAMARHRSRQRTNPIPPVRGLYGRPRR